MRQGPDYSQWIDVLEGTPVCPVPLELSEEFQFRHVVWHDNGDGTYTLTPIKEVY